MTGNPFLIGLSGKKRSGKDTTGNILVKEFGFTRFAFADALKQVALDINPVVVHINGRDWSHLQDVFNEYGSFESIKNSPWDDSVRLLLQQLGSVMAIRDNNIWAKPVIDAAAAHVRETGQGAVITDVRFPWESEGIYASGGVMVRVHRSDIPADAHVDQHISETMLDELVPYAHFDTTPMNGIKERLSVLLTDLAVDMAAGNPATTVQFSNT